MLQGHSLCRALELQAFLDTAAEVELLGIRDLLERGSSMNSIGSMGSIGSIGSDNEATELNRVKKKEMDLANAAMKFTYVVTCQIYGAQKIQKDNRADDILHLMKTYKALRIAYVDEVGTGREPKNFYSVLVKYDPVKQQEVEIYRIQLPGPVKLGEGKPENQNHAIIFTRGDAVQTIDMNQVMCWRYGCQVV
jgi:callose synthase